MDAYEEDSMEETAFIQHHTAHPNPPVQFQTLSMSTTSEAPPPMRPTLSPPNPPSSTPSALSLADSLVTAVKNLQTELATVQAKLVAAEQQLKEMPSESVLWCGSACGRRRECDCGNGRECWVLVVGMCGCASMHGGGVNL